MGPGNGGARVCPWYGPIIPGRLHLSRSRGRIGRRTVKTAASIAIIDFVGNYNKDLDTGESNVEARAVVAREFLRTHPDTYDFLVIFSTFEFATGDALAFHWGVQNKVQGLGLAQYDVSHLFGSAGRLLGYIDMAALTRYVTDPLQPAFETVLATLGHEMLHQWSGRARFVDASGHLSAALLGRDNSHWSDLLDTNASVLYGHKWRDNHDGTFTSEAMRKFFSPLDLYLAGVYSEAEVPPFLLIDNPQHDPTVLPQANITVQGTARTDHHRRGDCGRRSPNTGGGSRRQRPSALPGFC